VRVCTIAVLFGLAAVGCSSVQACGHVRRSGNIAPVATFSVAHEAYPFAASFEAWLGHDDEGLWVDLRMGGLARGDLGPAAVLRTHGGRIVAADATRGTRGNVTFHDSIGSGNAAFYFGQELNCSDIAEVLLSVDGETRVVPARASGA
jgi:hypothetical protein